MAQIRRKMAVNGLLFLLLAIFPPPFTGNPPENALNVPQVLLPYVAKGSRPTTFVLKALKGCFKWSSTKPNIASIHPVDDKSNTSLSSDEDESPCSQSALVTVKLKSPEEDTTVILAEEEGTGFTLRCDVFVDSIDKIEIATTTRELLLGESPEVFDVYAYDKEGNLFTSLGSQTFDWNFSPVPHNDRVDPRSVLRFIWFHDSAYETSAALYELEDQHIRGCSALVEGINTGEAIVTAKLSNPEYKAVNPSSVMLTVIDNVMLVPHVTYVMPHQYIQYTARQLRRGQTKDILLPSEQYTIKVVNKTVGLLSESDATVHGQKLGTTKVQLVDRNMANVSSVRRPTATLHVVEPGKIGFAINPGKLWTLQTQKIYELHVHLFDDDNNRIEVTDDTIFQSTLSKEYFTIFKKSKNGSYFHVQAKKIGNTMITAKTDHIQNPSKKRIAMKHLYGEQDIEIYDPVTVDPELIVFPWDASLSTTQSYKYQLNAHGGSGNYLWKAKNNSFASINKKGVVVTGSFVGQTSIKVSDVKNPIHSAISIVLVLPPHEMSFIVGTVEVEVGKQLVLPLVVSAFVGQDKKERKIFTDCRKMHLVVSFSDTAVFKHTKTDSEVPIPADGCTSIAVQGLNMGHTTLTAIYTYADVTLRASIVIAAYTPVAVVDPSDFATVTLGSKKTIVAEGGPLPWVLDSSRYYEVMSAEEEDWVQISHAKGVKDNIRNIHFFDVTCTQLGEQLLTIEVGNKATSKNRHPASSSATARYLCTQPATLKMYPVIVLPTIDGKRRTIESCQDEMKRIPVRNNRELRINLFVYDTNGNMFDEASALQIDWSVDDTQAVLLKNKDTLYERKEFSFSEKQNCGVQAYQMFHIHPTNAPVVVTATITAYRNQNVEHIITSPISAQLHLMLFSEPQISPNKLYMFAHPTNKLNLGVDSGTDNFVLKTSDGSMAKLQFSPPDAISVWPLEEGRLTVYLHDACLDAEGPAEAQLFLSDVYSLQLTVPDKVEMGQSIEARCQALDHHGHILSVVDVNKQLKLQLKMSADIMDVMNMRRQEGMQFDVDAKYNLTGKSVGLTSLTCQAATLSGTEITSKAEEVQVFSAIQLEPKYVLLIIGSTFQINSFGGPRPQSTTAFSIQNKTVANVSQVGLVTALVIGKTIVTGKSKGLESATGKEIIYSQDQTIVEVIRLKGFKISLKSRNIVNNAEVGIVSVGITDESPFTFATSPPYLQFYWSSSNHKVATIESLHYKAGVTAAGDNDFRAMIRTVSPGQVTIKLKVKVLSNDYSQVSKYAQLEDRIQIQVFEKLELLYPKGRELLLPHYSHTKIQTNRDQTSQLTYEILSSCGDASRSKVISISPLGQISAKSSSGTTNVMVVVHEEFGFNQTVVILVEVKPVSSISLISMSSNVVTSEARPSFPIGANAIFGVTLHDSTGRKFDVSNIPVKHRLSRSDIIHVVSDSENATFSVRGTSIGEAIFKVWDKENPSISDYIRLKIDEGIAPAKLSIPLGELECFSSTVGTNSGVWSSSGSQVSIDQNTGVAVGISTGSAMIHYNAHGMSTYTEITVTSPTNLPVIIDNDDYLFISNAMQHKLFYVALDETTERSRPSRRCINTGTVSTQIEVPFTCSAKWAEDFDDVRVTDLFDIEAVYVLGHPACSFAPRGLLGTQEKSVSTNDRRFLLIVNLVDRKSSSNYESPPVSVLFVPHVYIDDTTVNLGSTQTTYSLDVYGSDSQLSGIKVSTDSSIIHVDVIESYTNSRQRYKISVLEIPTSDTNVTVKFYSPITKVNKLLSVAVRGDGLKLNMCTTGLPKPGGTWRTFFSSNFGGDAFWIIAYTVIIATVILMLMMYHAIVKGRQPTPVVVASPYVMQHSPPPYHQYSPSYQSPGYTPGSSYSKGNPTSATPQRTLFSVSQ